MQALQVLSQAIFSAFCETPFSSHSIAGFFFNPFVNTLESLFFILLEVWISPFFEGD